MTFRLLADESVEEGVRRIAREQTRKALEELGDPELDPHDVVHQVRKRCKKVRGLLRLVRPEFETDYDGENTWYRDTSRGLSFVRDAQSVIECFDALMEHNGDHVDRGAFAPIREFLVERRALLAEDEEVLGERMEEARGRFEAAHERAMAWKLGESGFDAMADGIAKTYGRGRAAMAAAFDAPDTEAFHGWRKRVKYHGYHMRLVRGMWDGPLQARRNECDALSDALGDDHDLSVFREIVLERPEDVGDEATIQALLGLVATRQVELRTRALAIGERLFAEKPKHLVRRLERYWDAWRRADGTGSGVVHDPNLVTA